MCSVNELDNIDWVDVSIRALKHAQNKLMRFKIIKNSALDAEDFVHTAVERIYDGNRKWNKQRYPDFIDFINSVIDSLINHEINQLLENIKEPLFNNAGNEIKYDVEVAIKYKFDCFNQKNSLDIIIKEEEHRQFKNKIYQFIKGNKKLEDIFNIMEEGITEPRNIAELTGISVNDIYNILKILRRKLIPLKDTSLNILK
jgi:hypothetical protein